MKKLLSLVLCGVLVLGITGCGNDKTITKENGNKVNNQEENKDNNSKRIVCKTATEYSSSYGNAASGNYDYGDTYLCDVKNDSNYQVFYVIAKTENQISLIANSNLSLSDTVAWCSKKDYKEAGGDIALWEDNWASNSMGPITAQKYLEENTKDWVDVNVSLPKGQQLAKASGYNEWDGCFSSRYELPDFLTLENKYNSSGFWVEEAFCDSSDSFAVDFYGLTSAYANTSDMYGVRPVITINKNQIENITVEEKLESSITFNKEYKWSENNLSATIIFYEDQTVYYKRVDKNAIHEFKGYFFLNNDDLTVVLSNWKNSSGNYETIATSYEYKYTIKDSTTFSGDNKTFKLK